ncbi:MAG: TRAP transporter substrate-binding protein DctP [Desulfuromonadaceae bacterium]|nr:TRAP transporter substrate-binding protein DctP [Desulfuromonadaceae bacterium]MDD5106226.1 TRAP transporter substrate-binding protein DctP [Desulfuromonadaceae bacterium]
MKNCKKSMLFVLMLTVVTLATVPAFAAKYNFKLAHVITAGTPIDVGAHKFADLVKQRTNGQVEIKVFPAGQLGGERAIIEGVQLGTIEMSFTTTGAIAGFAPEFQVLDLPFLFPSYEAAYTYLDGEQGKKLLALLDRKGIHGVVFLENGWRNFTSSKRPINSPADIKGQKIRVMESPMYMGLISTMGGSPTPMAYPELPNALLQKVIDGQENPSVNIYSAKMYESQPWMTQDQHTYNVMIMKVNKRVWKSLPANIQKIIEDTAAEVSAFQRKLNRECDDDFIAKLKSKGMKVHVLTAAERNVFEKALLPMYDKGRSVAGTAWVNDAVKFRKEWDAGKYKSQEHKYIADFKKINVPVKETMANFK